MEHLTPNQKREKTMIAKHGSKEAWIAFMREIASQGGKNGRGTKRGFAAGDRGKALARKVGAEGGRVSRPRKRQDT